MSPEQAEGRLDQIDFRTDVFGLGAILYEILTGRPPFDGADTAEVLHRARTSEAPPPWTVTAGVPRALAAVCSKAMARRPDDRYPTAADLARDVQHWLADEPLEGCREPLWDRTQRWARRHKSTLAGLAALLLFTGLALVFRTEARSRVAQAQAEIRAAVDAEAQHRLEVQLYYHSVALAERELAANNLGRVSELLAACPMELRGWEWHLLARLGSVPQRVLRGHKAAVSAVVFSPDGRRLISASHDQTLKVWDIATRRELFSLLGHSDVVYDVVFSPDGRLAASTSWDKLVKIWDLSTGQVIRDFKGHTRSVQRLAFSPDGRHIASLGSDERVLIWTVAEGTITATYGVAEGQHLYRLAFSPDGSRLAVTSSQGVKLLDPLTGQVVGRLSGPIGEYVKCVAFSRDGQFLATGEGDLAYGDPGRVRVWNAATGDLLYLLEGHTEPIFALVFSPDGSRLFSASQDQTVKVWDLPNRREALTLRAHTDTVRSLALSPDGNRLVSAGADGTIRLWNATPGESVSEPDLLYSLEGHREAVFGVAFSPDDRQLVSLSLDGILRTWDTAAGRPLAASRPLHGNPRCFALAMSPDGRSVAIAVTDGNVYLVDAATGREGPILCGHGSGPIKGLAFSSDGSRLASASWDRTVRVWPLPGGDPLILGGHTESVLGVAFSPDGQLIASAGYDTTVRVWDAATGEPLQTLRGNVSRVHSVAFSRSGKLLASAGHDGTVQIWETLGWTLVATLSENASGVNTVAFGPDDRSVAFAGNDRKVHVWDLIAKEEVACLRGHTDRINALIFSQDGTRLASAGHDKTVKLWAFTRPEAAR